MKSNLIRSAGELHNDLLTEPVNEPCVNVTDGGGRKEDEPVTINGYPNEVIK
jgi:hypothetical protein